MNARKSGTENCVLKMIGTGNKSTNYKNSVWTFPDRKSSKGMCKKPKGFLN